MGVDLNNFYKGKKVFVTGHTGFKGSWLIQWLHLLGAEIKGYALAPENTMDLFQVIDGNKLCDSIIDDIRNFEHVKKEIELFQPDIIFHLAAQPLVRLSYDKPLETFEVNIMGTAHILEAAKTLKNKCQIVIVTTDKVYDNKEWHYPYRETDRLGGYDPYSASKAGAELVVSSYRNSFFNIEKYSQHHISIASARAGNVIGGGDWAKDRIVPDIVRALKEDQEIVVRNPHSIRPWQHVLEPLSGYLYLAEALYKNPLKFSESWNFGPQIEDTYTVEDLVKISIDIYGKGSFKTPENTISPHEAGLLKLDINKSINELNWIPKLKSKQAIEWTIEFYKNKDKRNLIVDQILKYQEL